MISRIIANVLINAQQAAQQLNQLATQGAQAFNRLAASATQASRTVGRSWTTMTGGAQNLATRINGVGISFRSMAAAFGAGIGIRELANASDTFIQLNNRIGQATSSAAEHNQVLQQIRVTSNETGSAIEDNSRAFIRFNLGMRELGGSTTETATIIDTLNKAFVVNGTTSIEARAGMHQLSQAFASGRLNGDEFRSVLENLPFLARKIAEEMGTTVGQLKEFAREGTIGPEVMRAAFASLREDTVRDFGQITRTIGMSLAELRNEFILWAGEAGQASGIATKVADALSYLAQNIDTAATAMLAFIGVISAGALGGALAGIVAGLGALFSIPGAIIASIIGIGGAIAYFALRLTEAEKAAIASEKAAKEHAVALEQLDAAIAKVNEGAQGATDEFVELARNHMAAADAAIAQAKAEVQLQEALALQNLELEHGAEEAARMISSGEVSFPAVEAARAKVKQLEEQQAAYAEAVSQVTIETSKLGKSTDKATASMRVFHGTSIGTTAMTDSFGKIVRVVKGTGDEIENATGKTKQLQEAMNKAIEAINAHEGKTQRVFRGTEHVSTILLDDWGRAEAIVNMVDGSVQRLSTSTRRAMTDMSDLDAVIENLEPLPEMDEKLFDQQQAAQRFKELELANKDTVSSIKRDQTGLVSDISSIWGTLSGIAQTVSAAIVADWNVGVKQIGDLWGSLVGYTEATIAELQPLWLDFKKWLSEQKFTINIIGLPAIEVNIGDLITNIQSAWTALETWWAEHGLSSPFDLGAIDKDIEIYRKKIEELGKLWDDFWDGDQDQKIRNKESPFGEEFSEEDFGGFGPLRAGMNNLIAHFQTKWEEFKTWWGGLFTAENVFSALEGLLEGFDSVIASVKSAWETFFGWFKTESDKAKPPSVGDMGPQAGLGSDTLTGGAGGDTIPAPTIAPVPATAALAALASFIPAAEETGAKAGDALYDKLALNMENQPPSENILDTRQFGWDSIVAEWDLILRNMKVNASAVAAEIGNFFKNMFSGGEEGAEGAPVAGNQADGLINAYLQADSIIRQIVFDLGNFIVSTFNSVGQPIGEALNLIITNTQAAFDQLAMTVTTVFSTIGPIISEAFTQTLEVIIEQIASFSQTLITAVSEAATAMVTAFQDALSALASVWSGIVEGATNTANRIKSVFQDAADAMVAAMKRAEAAAKSAESAARAAKAAASGSATGGPIGAAMAAGGRVWGAGTSMSDSIWRKLSRGEYVIRSASVGYYGQRLFDALNHMALPRDFLSGMGLNMGGLVTSPSAAFASPGSDAKSGPSSALFLELWKNGPVIKTSIDQDAVELVMRHTTGKQRRSIGKLPRGQ